MSFWKRFWNFLGVGMSGAVHEPEACDFPPLELRTNPPGLEEESFRVTDLTLCVGKRFRETGDADLADCRPLDRHHCFLPDAFLPDALDAFLAEPPPDGCESWGTDASVLMNLNGRRAAMVELLALLGDVRRASINLLTLTPFPEERLRFDIAPRRWRITLPAALAVNYGKWICQPENDRVFVSDLRLVTGAPTAERLRAVRGS